MMETRAEVRAEGRRLLRRRQPMASAGEAFRVLLLAALTARNMHFVLGANQAARQFVRPGNDSAGRAGANRTLEANQEQRGNQFVLHASGNLGFAAEEDPYAWPPPM